jgi:hypothetical protein
MNAGQPLARAPAARSPPLGGLVVGRDARWLVLPSGERLELHRQRAVRLILMAMVDERLARPGRALPGEALLASGWPGERVTPSSGSVRVRVAVSKLRSLGLRDLVVSRDDGYLLRADAEVVKVDTPV